MQFQVLSQAKAIDFYVREALPKHAEDYTTSSTKVFQKFRQVSEKPLAPLSASMESCTYEACLNELMGYMLQLDNGMLQLQVIAQLTGGSRKLFCVNFSTQGTPNGGFGKFRLLQTTFSEE